MKVNRFEFEEKPTTQEFSRVKTLKGQRVELDNVSPYAETQKLDAVNRHPSNLGPRAELPSD